MNKTTNENSCDTNTAVIVADYNNKKSPTDLNYYYEILYRTKRGSFFLLVKGNQTCKYEKISSNQFFTKERIIPLSHSQTLEWLQNNNEIEVIKEYYKN